MKVCAYCGKSDKLTREHIFPDFFSKEFPTYGIYVDRMRDDLPHSSAPIIRDVCSECNNNRLSLLDEYGRKLTNEYFARDLTLADITFYYDHNQLSRWLLKLWYNDARTHHENLSVYKSFIPYVLGNDIEPPLAFTLMMGIIIPTLHTEKKQMLFPKVNRYGKVTESIEGVVLGRLAFFTSYVFAMFIWKTGTPRQIRKKEIAKISQDTRLVELHRNDRQAKITSPCMSAMSAILLGR